MHGFSDDSVASQMPLKRCQHATKTSTSNGQFEIRSATLNQITTIVLNNSVPFFEKVELSMTPTAAAL